ncbi:hypothetical protein PSTG_11221 [Puccinia striiformis f. sp. tritici PST-78]|uniref:Uncharacterized protein n=1 Tax=Puccinia striiformis f. sp. tritici PST-78 TaxID=1165861 RepID=A0A0L0V8A3_9BASI|nr:hypothetical protein PSTG_11221 [Puccinia striiformis f. sp. tritici PST-78]
MVLAASDRLKFEADRMKGARLKPNQVLKPKPERRGAPKQQESGTQQHTTQAQRLRDVTLQTAGYYNDLESRILVFLHRLHSKNPKNQEK